MVVDIVLDIVDMVVDIALDIVDMVGIVEDIAEDIHTYFVLGPKLVELVDNLVVDIRSLILNKNKNNFQFD
jgi:hypothetical protein